MRGTNGPWVALDVVRVSTHILEAVPVPTAQVQQAKRKMPLFSECKASYLGGCRVWVEPVTAGLRPMLHGDRWLHRACRMAIYLVTNLLTY